MIFTTPWGFRSVRLSFRWSFGERFKLAFEFFQEFLKMFLISFCNISTCYLLFKYYCKLLQELQWSERQSPNNLEKWYCCNLYLVLLDFKGCELV